MAPMHFPDVAPTDWFAASVERLADMGIVNGYPDGTFRPLAGVTLAEMVKLLLAAMGYTEPVDTVPWYAGYARRAEQLGLTVPAENPDYAGPVPRWQVARLLCRALGLPLLQWDEVVLPDVPAAVKPWVDTVFDEYLMRGEIVNGARQFRPNETVIRAEAAVVTVRLVDYRADAEGYRRSRAPSLVPGDRLLEFGVRVFAADATGVWASGQGGRVLYRSEDRGVSWRRLHDFGKAINDVHLTPRGVLLVSAADHYWDPQTDGELFRSVDGGATFTSVLKVKSGCPRFWSIASDDAGYVFAAEYGYKDLPDNSRRVYRSADDGRTWRMVYEPPETAGYHCHRLLIDKRDPRVLFLSIGDGENSKIIRSRDRGDTWELHADGLNPTGAYQFDDYIIWGLDNTPRTGMVLLDPDTGATVGEFEPPEPYHGSAYDFLYANGILYTGLLSYYWDIQWWDGSLWISRDQGQSWELWAVWPKVPGQGIGFYKFTRQGDDGYIYVTLPVIEDGQVVPFEGTLRFPLL